MRHSCTCRVCGIDFPAARFDAQTCSDTCRSRRARGGDLAYLNDPTLGRKRKRLALASHEANDVFAAAHREYVAATRKVRELGRERRQRQAAEERQRLVDQMIGAGVREAQAKAGRQRQRGAAALKLFAQERRDLDAAAIAAMLKHYPVDLVAALLAELKASGDFDRIVAEAAQPPSN
jgi:hypothetical protein